MRAPRVRGMVLALFVASAAGASTLAAAPGARAVHPFMTHMLLANDDLIARNPAALRRFIAAWFETVVWAKAHKAETLRYSMAATRLPEDISSAAYDKEIPMFLNDGHFAPQDVAAVEQALMQTRQLDKLPDNSKIMTEEFLK